jgi:hypothetical protein
VGKRSDRPSRWAKSLDQVISANLTKRQLDYEWVIDGQMRAGKRQTGERKDQREKGEEESEEEEGRGDALHFYRHSGPEPT